MTDGNATDSNATDGNVSEAGLITASGRKLPKMIGGYRVLRRLSRGGMGEVLLGMREVHGFEKKVAIKVVLPHVAEDEEFRLLFFDEAKLMARMSHTHIAQVFDFGVDEGHLFLVMEFVDGLSIEQIFRTHQERQSRMAPELVGLVIAHAARGLHSAHSLVDDQGMPLGVVHRDVSPQNLLVTYAGNTKVLDFGIARSNVRSGQTQVGVVRGKPGYMAPEQAKNLPLDARTDIFQLGIVLFELLTTRELYVRDNMYEAIAAAVDEPVPDVTKEVVGIDPGFQDVLSAALAKDPNQRFTTADAMARALDVVIARCGYPVTEAALGDHLRELRPKAEPSTTSGRPASVVTAAAQKTPAGGRAAGQNTVELAEPDVVAGAAAAAARVTQQPVMKTLTAAQTGTAVPTQATGIGIIRAEERKKRWALAGMIAIGLVFVVGVSVLSGSGSDARKIEPSKIEPPKIEAAIGPTVVVADAGPSEVALATSQDAGARLPREMSNAVETEKVVTPPKPARDRRRRRRRTRAPDPAVTTVDSPSPTPATAPEPSVTEALPPEVVVAPVKKTFGTLFVVSDPYAQIFVDGKRRGDSPKMLKLSTGAHEIKLVDPQSDEVWLTQSVTIKEGKNRSIRAKGK